MALWIPIFALLFTQAITVMSGTACSPSNLTTAADDCIMAVRNALVDVDRFWFGSDYNERCTGSMAHTADCINLFPPGSYSIASLMFWQNTLEVDLIKHFLEVKYTSGPGKYEGCGTSVTRNTTQVFRLDPLSEDAYPPWDARSMPEVSWPTEDNRSYTLIVIDVGFGFTHGIYVNIDGKNMSSATVLKPYSGPKNFRRIPNPYAFFLFEQTGKLTIGDQWMGIIKNPMLKFNISDFQEQHQLKGPTAVNWLLSSYDAYSINAQAAWGTVDNCASLIQDKVAVYHSNRPWLKMTYPLTMKVQVHFKVEAMNFKMCCKHLDYPAKSFALDPLSNNMVLPVETRTGQKVELKLSPSGSMLQNMSTEGKHYTMLMVDPDVPKAPVGTNARPLLHWLVINMAVHSNGTPEGTTIHPYSGPAPPDQKPHTYYYLLYEQQEELMLKNTEDFDGQCGSSLVGKCLFDVEKFQKDLNLTLVGLSWMTAHNDHYTNYTKTTQGQDMDQFCKWTPGYKSPCEVPPNKSGSSTENAAGSHPVSVALLIFSGLLAAILKWQN